MKILLRPSSQRQFQTLIMVMLLFQIGANSNADEIIVWPDGHTVNMSEIRQAARDRIRRDGIPTPCPQIELSTQTQDIYVPAHNLVHVAQPRRVVDGVDKGNAYGDPRGRIVGESYPVPAQTNRHTTNTVQDCQGTTFSRTRIRAVFQP